MLCHVYSNCPSPTALTPPKVAWRPIEVLYWWVRESPSSHKLCRSVPPLTRLYTMAGGIQKEVYIIYIYPLLVIQSCNSKRPSMVQIPETPPPPSDNSAQAQLFRGCVLFPRTWVSQVDVRASSGLDSAFPAVATSPKKKGCVTFVSERTLSLSPRGRFVGCIWLHDVAFLKKLCDKSISFSGPFR